MEFPKYNDNLMLFYFGIFIRKQNQDTGYLKYQNKQQNREDKIISILTTHFSIKQPFSGYSPVLNTAWLFQ